MIKVIQLKTVKGVMFRDLPICSVQWGNRPLDCKKCLHLLPSPRSIKQSTWFKSCFLRDSGLLNSSIFRCLVGWSSRCPALVTSPLYDGSDHTNHVFSEST